MAIPALHRSRGSQVDLREKGDSKSWNGSQKIPDQIKTQGGVDYHSTSNSFPTWESAGKTQGGISRLRNS